jgi:hypothetical protein
MPNKPPVNKLTSKCKAYSSTTTVSTSTSRNLSPNSQTHGEQPQIPSDGWEAGALAVLVVWRRKGNIRRRVMSGTVGEGEIGMAWFMTRKSCGESMRSKGSMTPRKGRGVEVGVRRGTEGTMMEVMIVGVMGAGMKIETETGIGIGIETGMIVVGTGEVAAATTGIGGGNVHYWRQKWE